MCYCVLCVYNNWSEVKIMKLVLSPELRKKITNGIDIPGVLSLNISSTLNTHNSLHNYIHNINLLAAMSRSLSPPKQKQHTGLEDV